MSAAAEIRGYLDREGLWDYIDFGDDVIEAAPNMLSLNHALARAHMRKLNGVTWAEDPKNPANRSQREARS